MHALALEHVKLGEDATARNLFEKLLDADPGYVGSYYHLGKLLERTGMLNEAAQAYSRGLEKAAAAKDRHAASELQQALDEIEI
jgi:Tfp pilus assembly protein PilF